MRILQHKPLPDKFISKIRVWIWHIFFTSSNSIRYVHEQYGVNLTVTDEVLLSQIAVTFKPGYHDVLILKKVTYVLVWSYLRMH